MSEETGGPAFPQSGAISDAGDVWQSSELGGAGLTVRDYFAAKAMQSLYCRAGGSPAIDADSCDYFANHAYQMADSMLKARDKVKE